MDIVVTGTSNKEVDLVKLEMDAQLGLWVPILAENVCGTSLECPVRKSGEWTMDYHLEVDGRLPNGNIETRLKLVGNSDADEIMCALIQVKVD